jgi:hypothetical protein
MLGQRIQWLKEQLGPCPLETDDAMPAEVPESLFHMLEFDLDNRHNFTSLNLMTGEPLPKSTDRFCNLILYQSCSQQSDNGLVFDVIAPQAIDYVDLQLDTIQDEYTKAKLDFLSTHFSYLNYKLEKTIAKR